jgi:ATP-dependent Clp protease, protease subunit
MKKSKADLSLSELFEDAPDKPNEIWVNSFDEAAAQKFRKQMMSAAKSDKHKPIVIYIDSYGGYVDSLAKMIETMDELPNPKVTVCLGKAMSCGAILLSHGDARFCGPHSRVMVHEVSGFTFGDVHDMHADTEETKRLNEHFMGLLARNCGMTGYRELRRLIKERDGRELYMNAKKSLEFGIVDAVGIPKVNDTTFYEISAIPPKQGRTSLTEGNSKSDSKKRRTKGDKNVRKQRTKR